jgi:hypothetical protein
MIARRATAQRPEVLDADAGRRTLLKAERTVVALLGVLKVSVECVLQRR